MNTGGGKILVIRGGAIGDFILTLPAIAALRQQFPGAHLEVLGYPHIVQLALTAGLVDCARSIEARPLAGFFARDGVLSEDMADYFSEFDLIVSYLYDPDEVFRSNVGRCSPAQFIHGPHRPDESRPLHATHVFLEPLEKLAIFGADPVPRIALPVRNCLGSGPDVLALHPGSGSDAKNWPESNWAQLVERLVEETKLDLLLVGGEAEGQRLQRLSAPFPSARIRLAQTLALPELALQLRDCSGFIGHDSGISHLASAVGLTSLLLWGETNQEIWRPAGQHTTVLRDPAGLPALPVNRVFQTIQQLWGKLSRVPGTLA